MKLDKTSPVTIEKVYYTNTMACASVIIHLKEASKIKLDSIYFQGRKTNLKTSDTTNSYIGYFDNFPKDLIMDIDPKKEYANQIDTSELTNFPFTLKEDECIISFSKNLETHYFKIQKLIKKAQ